MVASMEAFVPILASMIYSNLYNATIELAYPWQGSFYFLSAGLTIIGKNTWMCTVKGRMSSTIGAVVTVFVYASLGFKQIQSAEEEEREQSFHRQSSNLHPDEANNSSKRAELLCLSMKRVKKFE